jgi:hypothetical protein
VAGHREEAAVRQIHHGKAELAQNRDEGGSLTLRRRLGWLGTAQGGYGWPDVEESWRR